MLGFVLHVFGLGSVLTNWCSSLVRLPHGVDDVRRHLEEVDNVPLLVSLYTDVTKKTAADMVRVGCCDVC